MAHAFLSLSIQQAFSTALMICFPLSFTLAEACIVANLLTLLGMDAWTATFFRVCLSHTNMKFALKSPNARSSLTSKAFLRLCA